MRLKVKQDFAQVDKKNHHRLNRIVQVETILLQQHVKEDFDFILTSLKNS